ncbi:MAG: tetratricopeptide repeat protein [Bryobacterales bacterium]|nr:tetratricopeptide repeat protein [Bryobacterales bacterium]
MCRANFALSFALAACLIYAAPGHAQPSPQLQSDLLRQGQQQLRQGKVSEALTLYRQELANHPSSVAANNAMGVALDLEGRTSDARKHFAKAIEAAPNAQAKAAAERAMAMSYAFDNDCANTVKYERMVIAYWVAEKNFYQQGEMMTEAARVCLEAGDLAAAAKYYEMGRDTGLKEPGIQPDRVSLWNYRWEHAQARIAARRGNKALAEKHVAAARALLDKDPEMAKAQAIFFPYLTGYVALYTGDARAALADLAKANQNDPFIQCLIGQAHEKLGERDQAVQAYTKAYATTAHNPPAAFAKPFARKKLAELK